MNAVELRIGNLLRSNNPKYRPDILGETLVVSGINSEKDNSHFISGTSVSVYRKSNKHKDTFGQYLEFLAPIPLTEEWLLKLGFEKDGFSYYLNSKIYKFHFQSKNGDYVVNTEFSAIKNGGNPSNKEDYHVLSYNINHVHELQNIYFALTGKELASDSAQL